MQSFSMIHNYIQTGRCHEAVTFLTVLQNMEPDNPLIPRLFQLVTAKNGMAPESDLTDMFGRIWGGENLNGKSIEVICDQGMGDLVNMLGYLNLLKTRYNCHVVVICYAFHAEFKRLFDEIEYVDEFLKYHKLCDYTTNMFSLPTILSGIKLPVQYPAHFAEVMKTGVPLRPYLMAYSTFSTCRDEIEVAGSKLRVGVSWKSNPDNNLFLIKSIPLEIIKELKSDKYDLYSLIPDDCPEFMKPLMLRDLYDTTAAVYNLDYVVSVDTVVLHLAGSTSTQTFGLIPDECDPRWGTEGEDAPWYPHVKLVRQNKDWSKAVKSIKESLEQFSNIL